VIQNDGSTTYLYVDGVLDTSIPDALHVGNGDYYNKLYLGKSNLNVQPFTGYLNDARIYDRMLSASEIDSLYQGAGSTTTGAGSGSGAGVGAAAIAPVA